MPHSEIGKYPYFVIPVIERYRELDPNSVEACDLRLLIDVNVTDPEARVKIFGINSSFLSKDDTDLNSNKEETLNPIDTFLDKYAANIKPAGYMQQEEIALKSEDTSLSALIKAHKYHQALKLIEAQNLNNPQKSIYFAHQMRFLKKLISIQRHSNINQG